MVVAVFPAGALPVKTGSRRDINFTAKDRPDALTPAFLVEIHNTVHHAVICDGRAVHAQFLHSGNIIPDLIGSVQKTVFCMCVQMCESHAVLLLYINHPVKVPEATFS